MRDIILIAHDIRSTHNVGSLLRTADGLGVSKVYFSGYTPYPQHEGDDRLPHIAARLDRQIHKTALGAEHSVSWEYSADIDAVLTELKSDGYVVAALEQSAFAVPLYTYEAPQKIAVLLGREVEGIEPKLLEQTDVILEIPMSGDKESFNVVQAAAMALYALRFS